MESLSLPALQTKIKADAKIDISALDRASIDAPYLYSKYIAIHANEKMWLSVYKKQLTSLTLKKTAYYLGDATEDEYRKNPLHIKVSKTMVSKYVNGDSDIQELDSKIEVQNIKVDLLKEYMKVLYQKTFHIKNAIDFQKFVNGVV